MRGDIVRMVDRVARTYFFSWADVEDAKQEGLLKVLQMQASVPNVGMAQLAISVRNRLIDMCRRRKKQSKAEAKWAEDSDHPRDREDAGERYEALVAALSRALPGGLAQIFLELALPSEAVCKNGKVRQSLIAAKLGLSRSQLNRKLVVLRDAVERMMKI